MGNTCFLNSVLQCLTYTIPFAELAKKKKISHQEVTANKRHLLFNGITHQQGIKIPTNSSPPYQFSDSFRIYRRSFRPGRQEDAHEFLRTFIDALQKSCLRVAGLDQNDSSRRAETTSIHHIFGGYLQSQLKCEGCKYTSTTHTPCLDISLEILSGNIGSIEQALKQHTKSELLDFDNLWRCDGL